VLDGDARLAPGVEAVLVGGHTPGEQIVLVATSSRQVVLTCDAVHLYEEMERGRPFAIANDPDAMRRTYTALDGMDAAGALIVAGHDPEVGRRFAPGRERDSVIPIVG
jgi:glyoxylase-like metal-dependent hydrolase (beta-lactamase superfamily II)